ncbi:hypothetical protein EDD52_13010 [Primorskyibacter sedentarius]|uniref:HKD family nuclease n=1 Tax=Primorskyibacter sedentarius TaxID=745311 RepID=A0A4R3IX80_9RHOB|nr:phospholipase D family protein [Primorskyibacter sedentarius]TCS55607.1 hypothetical protein EDD52_13010 [Primorskyibacter sedentarius]
MPLILGPSNQSLNPKKLYEKAFLEATELYVLSAYLTAWDYPAALNPRCSKFRLIVGTDFGITRKQALKNALMWLPNDQKCNFLAADLISGFHPKAAFWKDQTGDCYCVIGSSNQTNAAFTTNYEVNISSEIGLDEFDATCEWIKNIEKNCSQVNEYWIDQYKEGTPPPPKKPKKDGSKKGLQACDIQVPTNFHRNLLRRNEQMKAYMETRDTFMSLVEKCATGQLSNAIFYQEFTALWGGNHLISFQSDVWKITGKKSNLSEICHSLIKVRDSKTSSLDDLVRVELDRLEKLKNPTRKSLFTEFLCKEFPDQYPVWNKPIEGYLKFNNLEFPRGSSFGSKYIHMAREMRKIVKREGSPVKDLTELDLLIGLQQGWS